MEVDDYGQNKEQSRTQKMRVNVDGLVVRISKTLDVLAEISGRSSVTHKYELIILLPQRYILLGEEAWMPSPIYSSILGRS